MGRPRTVAGIIPSPTHHGNKECVTMTAMVHTVTLPEGSFTALVLSNDVGRRGAIAIMDHDDVEALIALLQLAVEDAKRIDRGEVPLAREAGAPGTARQ